LRRGAKIGALAFSIPWLYEFGTQLLKYVQAPLHRDGWLPHLPPPAHRWTMARPFPSFGADFRAWFRNRTPEGRARGQQHRIGIGILVAGIAALGALIFVRKKK
ncbi:MAG: hypothetical protein L0Y55_05950, partial [Anaerolineales bacterium]|nr:hypothetical protein [Anaerolineales bacterium]